ncbi:MAG: tyrosine-type recombinase/integrase [Deltaproteobacteria bacterium]|nr:tyrosine-type recombinase/integrase [Deltaproteobacteria bacterium]
MIAIDNFQQIVDSYIQEKRSLGFKFDKEARMLRHIIALQLQLDQGSPLLSKETVSTWIERRSWESVTNRSHRISLIRCLGKYMVRMGYKAYVIPDKFAPLQSYAYIPYIFSDNELRAFLLSVDIFSQKTTSEHASLVFPLLFRILVGCGLRISEALSIKKQDVDLEKGTLLLLNTKNEKERIIPMADSLCEACRKYALKIQFVRKANESKYFLPNPEGKAYAAYTAYSLFRQILQLAGISHGGRGKGPRLHDLRHTFAVRVLKKWVLEGKNLTTAMPYLSIYMGHVGLKATQHYLKLTSDMFPELIKTVEKRFGWIIPEAYHERD